jgi:hypothetical protein
VKFHESSGGMGNAPCCRLGVSPAPDVSLKLTVRIRGEPYYLTVSAQSFKLVRKGRREAIELPWSAFASEDAAMLSALHASIARGRR